MGQRVATYSVILPAAGRSTRFRDQNYKKPFAPLNNRAVWLHTADRFLNRKDVKQTILLLNADDREYFQTKFGADVMILGVDVVTGGKERSDSVAAALAKVRDDCDFVAIHDAVRPCIADSWIDKVFEKAAATGAAILAVPATSTLKRSGDGLKIDETVSRDDIWIAQTPQVFRRDLLIEAYAKRGSGTCTDDAQLVEQLGHPVSLVQGSPLNIKITTRDDLKLAGSALRALPKPKLAGPSNPFADDDMWR